MACSAVVMGIAEGVFITITAAAWRRGISTLSTPIPARPTTFSFCRFQYVGGELVGERWRCRLLIDDLISSSLVRRFHIGIDAAFAEDGDGSGDSLSAINISAWRVRWLDQLRVGRRAGRR